MQPESGITIDFDRDLFWTRPPSIDEFLSYTSLQDGIYDFWIEKLRYIYPTNTTVRNNYVLFTGAIGTGKSTVSKIMALYTLTRLLCLKDLSPFKLIITKPIQFVFFHVKMEKARSEFIEFLNDFIHSNSYFTTLGKERKKAVQRQIAKPIPFSFVADGVKSNNAIGGDVVFYVFSEANFVSEKVIINKLDQSYKRFKSRFILAKDYLGNIIVDTSANYEGSVSDFLVETGDFYTIRASQWEVKPFAYFKKGYFYVFLGEGDQPPCMVNIEDAHNYPSDKLIKVPEELRKEFNNNLYDSLISLAGINVRSPNALFIPDVLYEVFDIENRFDDIINMEDLTRVGYALLDILSRNYEYFLHIDTSLSGDNTGIAIAHFDKDGNIIVPFAAGVNNKGKEIKMYVIEEFVKTLAEQLFINSVTADSYQSYKLLQDIHKKCRVNTKILSPDSNPTIYFTLKKAVGDRRIRLVRNMYLLHELSNLKVVLSSSQKPRVDHPSNSSKDIADAVACAVFNLVQNGRPALRTTEEQKSASDLDEYLRNYRSKVYSQIRGPFATKSYTGDMFRHYNQNTNHLNEYKKDHSKSDFYEDNSLTEHFN